MQVAISLNTLKNKAEVSIGTKGSAFRVAFLLPSGWSRSVAEQRFVADISAEDRDRLLKALKSEGKRQKRNFVKTQKLRHRQMVRRRSGMGGGKAAEGSSRPVPVALPADSALRPVEPVFEK